MSFSNVQPVVKVAAPPPSVSAETGAGLDRLRALASGRSYEAPRIVSFPVVAPTVEDAMTFTGNF